MDGSHIDRELNPGGGIIMEELEYRAAGGVVLDDGDRVLLIERWMPRPARADGKPALVLEVRLPKGHVEPGETDEQAARREVCEETGYCGLAVIADLGEIVNEFDWPGKDLHVLRHEHYYLMRLTDPARRAPHFDRPDADEARFTPRWAADLAQAETLITFASEREFVRRAAAGAAP
jgi:8-oxo-dGTP pyrophosphatase MutT (NUDIX family)